MKIIYQSDDGTLFSNEKDCIEYDAKNKLTNHITNYINVTYNDDAGFGIIEVDNVENYIRLHIVEINKMLGISAV